MSDDKHTSMLDIGADAVRKAGDGLGYAGGFLGGLGRAAGDVITGHADQAGKHITETAEYGGKHFVDNLGDATKQVSKGIGEASGTVSGHVAAAGDYIKDKAAGKSDKEALDHHEKTLQGWKDHGREKGEDIGGALADGSAAKGVVKDVAKGVNDARRDVIKAGGHGIGVVAGGQAAAVTYLGSAITGHGKDAAKNARQVNKKVISGMEGVTGGTLAATDAVVEGAGGLLQTGVDAATGAKTGVGDNLGQTAKKAGDAVAGDIRETRENMKDNDPKAALKRTGGDLVNLAFNPAVDIGVTAATGGAGAAVGALGVNEALGGDESSFIGAFNAKSDDRNAAKSAKATYKDLAKQYDTDESTLAGIAHRNYKTEDDAEVGRIMAKRAEQGHDGLSLIGDGVTLPGRGTTATTADRTAGRSTAATPDGTGTVGDAVHTSEAGDLLNGRRNGNALYRTAEPDTMHRVRAAGATTPTHDAAAPSDTELQL